jgi:hypothetical protein
LLDNEALPADESYSVPVGNHTISFRSDVYGRVDTTLYVASGATRRLDLYYESVLNISTGAVTAVVMVNGDFIGESPVFGHKLGPGEYRIRVEKVGYRAVPVDTVLTLRPRFGEQREIPLSFRLEQQ